MSDGIPAPNPSYEIPVHNVSGNNNIKIQNKNLFDESILNQYKISEDDEAYIFNSNTLYNVNLTPNVKFKENTSYTIQYIAKQTTGNPRLRIKYTDGTYDNVETSSIATSYTKYIKVSNPQKTIDYITEVHSIITTDSFYIKKNSVMVEIGSTATTYVKHQQQNLPLTLGNIELCKIDEAIDYFIKENGKWYLHKEIGYQLFNGTETGWANISPSSNYVFQTSLLSNLIKKPANNNTIIKTIANNFIGNYSANRVYGQNIIGIGVTSSGSINFGMGLSTDITTKTLFIEWLESNNIKFYYPLETPTNTEITDTTLINQLEAISKAKAYKGTTYIEASSSDLEPIIKVQYWESEE